MDENPCSTRNYIGYYFNFDSLFYLYSFSKRYAFFGYARISLLVIATSTWHGECDFAFNQLKIQPTNSSQYFCGVELYRADIAFLIAVFVLDNQMTTSDYFTYVPIWLSLIVIGIEGILNKNKVR